MIVSESKKKIKNGEIQARNLNFETFLSPFSALGWSLRCLRFGSLHLLLTELSFDTPGVEIGSFLKKKRILSPI
jgi:hypothetical protein